MNLTKLCVYFVLVFCPLCILWYRLAPIWLSHVLVIETLLVAAWHIASFVYQLLNSKRISPYKKLVLITGCDSGFGHELAKRLDGYGKTLIW